MFLPNFPRPTFIWGPTLIRNSRVTAQIDIEIYFVLSVLCTRKEKFEIEHCAV